MPTATPTIGRSSPRVLKPEDFQRLPPFPAAAMRLLQLLSKDDFESSELLEIVKSDPMFSAELLRTVNSARFARGQQVTGFKHAAALLGRETLRSFAVAVSMRLYLGNNIRQDALARIWKHSLATAVCAELLTVRSRDRNSRVSESPYIAGLLHNVGSLGLMMLYPTEYVDVLKEASEDGRDPRILEVEHFGLDHCIAGRWIAGSWKFGPEIADVVLHHHDPCTGEMSSVLEIVKVAVRLTDALVWPSSPGVPRALVEGIAGMPQSIQNGIAMSPDDLYAAINDRVQAFS
jgi:HD-like signal output (HDOD) protein